MLNYSINFDEYSLIQNDSEGRGEGAGVVFYPHNFLET